MRSWVAGLVAVCLAPAPVVAQHSINTLADSPVMPAQAGSQYDRYTPGECYQLGIRTEWQHWNGAPGDTIAPAKWGGRMMPFTIEAVRQCLARFDVATVTPADLLYLGKAYVLAERDSAADAAFDRLIKSMTAQSVDARALKLMQIVGVYTSAHPARLDRAANYLRKLDALGDAAATYRMIARDMLANVAAVADSTAMIATNSAQALALAKVQPEAVRKQRIADEIAANVASAEAYIRRGRLDSARAVNGQGQATIVPLRPRITALGAGSRAKDYKKLGDTAMPIQAQRWFNRPDGVSYPVAGKVTMVVFAYFGCSGSCYPGYAVIRRLRAKYPPDKFAIVMLAQTWGFDRDRLISTDDETERIRAYFLDKMKLDMALAVWQTTFKKMDDGKVQDDVSPNWAAYNFETPQGEVTASIVDQRGKFRLAIGLNEETERRVDGMIHDLLEK